MLKSKSFNVVDIAGFVGLGLIALSSGVLAVAMPELVCLAPFAGALLGMGMLWFKRGDRLQASIRVLLTAVLLLGGFGVMGFGAFALTGAETDLPLLANLTFASTLCLAPGGLLVLAAARLYWVQQRREGQTAVFAPAAADDLPPTTSETILGYRARLAQARRYRQQILALVEAQAADAFGLDRQQVTADLARWENRIRQLVSRLSAYEENEVVRADETAVPAAIARLEAQLAAETDPALRSEIEQTLAVYRQQQAQLAALRRLMRRTQLDLEETVAAMGTLYSQLQVLGAMEIDSGRAKRLAHDVSEQVHKLDDLLAAVEEVYGNSRVGP